MEKPVDLAPLRTRDGSFTLRSERLDEHYHSVLGAVQESWHVFIDAGLRTVRKGRVEILEVGLGTGLNVLLTWEFARAAGWQVDYTALEPHPLDEPLLRSLRHVDEVAGSVEEDAFIRMLTVPESTLHQADDRFSFIRTGQPVQVFDELERFDLVYFDAFGPNTQPDMWTTEVFRRVHRAMRTGGILVTYCAKGEVRRTMQAAGFSVERLPGPPGKREMLRATRPSHG